jgi:basic membrane protein A
MSFQNKGLIAGILIVIIGIGAVGAYIIIYDPFAPPPDEFVENPYDVAIVFATGGLGDKSFNDGCKQGADDAVTELSINYTYVEPTSITEYEGYLRSYAEHTDYDEPYDLIISIGFDQADAVMAVAEDYPNQYMAIVDMYIDPATYPNVTSLLFNEHEGSALVGAMAGLMTDTLINKFAAGYVFGANYTNEGINHTIAYVGHWADPGLGQTLANGMYAAGTDVIFAAAGRSGLGVIASAKANNISHAYRTWAIGVDSPQMYLGCVDPEYPVAPTLVMTSMLKRVDVAVYNVIEQVVDDTYTGGLMFFSLSNGGIDYEINEDLLVIAPAIITEINTLKAAIIAGTVVVPDEIYWT